MTKRRSPPTIAAPGRAATPIASRHYRDYRLRALTDAKSAQGATVSLCIPAHGEEATIGDIVTRVRRYLVDRVGLVDEVLVLDDHSTDDTAKVAEAAGARVVQAADVLTDVAGGSGKGEALWRSLYAAEGDIVVWCDADITDFG